MKKVVASGVLVALIAVIGYLGVTAFSSPSKPPAPVQYTVAQAAAQFNTQFATSLASQGATISGTKCLVVVNGKAVPTRSANVRGGEFVCIISLTAISTGKLAQCAGVQFKYPAGASSVTVTNSQSLALRYCA